jgi:hypothetical protein
MIVHPILEAMLRGRHRFSADVAALVAEKQAEKQPGKQKDR